MCKRTKAVNAKHNKRSECETDRKGITRPSNGGEDDQSNAGTFVLIAAMSADTSCAALAWAEGEGAVRVCVLLLS